MTTLYEYKEFDFESLPNEVREALTYWQELKGSRQAPTWTEFELMRIPHRLLPYTNVVDVIDGGSDFSVRFYGSNLAEIHGELTGKMVTDAEPAELADAVLESMREVVSLGTPTARIAQIYPRQLVVLQSLIRLPLCDDGRNVSQIVTVAQYEQNVRDSKDAVESTFT